jgi:ATP-binding cassette subfamily B protein RaxB
MQNPLSLLKFTFSKNLPLILQTEIAECGIACLCMIAGYHGHDIDLNTLRRKYPISLRGTTLHDLMQTADKMHFTTRPLRLELEELPELQAPCILHWDLNHFVVLKKATPRYIIIHDPAQGERKLAMNEVSKHFTGVALELSPTQSFEQKIEKRRLPITAFWHKIVGLKRALFQVFLLSIVLQVFSLISPQYMQLVVDNVLLSADMHLLKVLAMAFALLAFISLATEALRSLLVLSLGSMLSIQMAANLFRHLIRLPLTYFEKRHIGDVVSRFGSLSQIQGLLTTGIVQTIVDGIMAVGVLIMLFLYSPLLACIVLVALALYAGIRWIWYHPLRQLNEESIVAGAQESTNFMESIRGIQSIKMFGKEVQRQVLWQNRYANKLNTSIRLGKLNITFSALSAALSGLENIIVVYLAAMLVLENQFTVGMLFAFMSYKQQFSSKGIALIEKWIELRMLGLHLERLADIALEPQEQHEMGMENPPVLKGDIVLENVSYRYSENEPYIFQNINLTIKAGESIALIGPSGCGKTTLLKIMMGLFNPTDGKVLVDGIPLSKLGVQNFRDQTAGVMQNDQLLSGSMTENICFFEPQYEQEKVEQAAKMAVIDHDIQHMPMQYNTLIGDMGTTLSGGQKQRVILARALYREPKILFLDEATSHLDVPLEQAVNQAIKSMQVTRVIVAHRPETIRSADRVVVFTPNGLQEQSLTPEQ